MASRKKHTGKLTKAQLAKKYAGERHELKQLQRKGLISSRAKLNAKEKPKPSSSLLHKLHDLRPVLNGYATPVYQSAKQRREWRSAGKPVYGKYLVVEHARTQQVKENKSGEIELISHGSPFKQVLLPVDVRRFDRFYDWASADPDRLQDMLGPGEFFSFTFYGNASRESGGAGWLLEYLQHYKPLFNNDGTKAKDANKAFQHLTIYRVDEESRFSFSDREGGYEGGRGTNKRRYSKADATGRSRIIGERGGSRGGLTSKEWKKRAREELKADPKAYRQHRLEEAQRVASYRKEGKKKK